MARDITAVIEADDPTSLLAVKSGRVVQVPPEAVSGSKVNAIGDVPGLADALNGKAPAAQGIAGDAFAAVPRLVLSRVVTAPPGSPVVGDAYIVPTDGTTSWGVAAGTLRQWSGTAWTTVTPAANVPVRVQDEDALIVWTGSAWQQAGAPASQGLAGDAFAAMPRVVLSRSVADPPSDSSTGDTYLVPVGVTTWGYVAGTLRQWSGTAWTTVTPVPGAPEWLADEGLTLTFDGSGWIASAPEATDAEIHAGSVAASRTVSPAQIKAAAERHAGHLLILGPHDAPGPQVIFGPHGSSGMSLIFGDY